jgi:DNA primase
LREFVAGRVPEHIIQQIVRSVDFVRLASRHCDLKKKGKSYWALCPFHEEKTPSFSIDPDNGLYYCFGCKEGGNVFTFLEKMEGLSFGEALRRLAAEAGVDLSRYETSDGPSRDELAGLRRVNELATSFYQKCVAKARGSQKARDFLAGRQISEESVETWRIGYAPEGWDNFLKCALGRDFGAELLVRAGLAVPREGAPGHYDRFRDRLMFPIGDATGRTIGFGARALKSGDEPKYLNSPETPLFSKGRSFFGLAQARAPVRSGGTAVVLEGYTDVIMAHQCGVPEAVAVLGTALTEQHARALSRLCERVVLVFDADEAGVKSATRSIEVLLKEDLEIRVADLPAGQDPCDFLLESGGEAFRRRLEASRGFFEFRLGLAREEHDVSTVEGRMAALREVAELALVVADEARRDMIVRWLAQELGIREASAWAYVERHFPARRGRPRGEGPAPARLRADEALPRELLGFLLSHDEFLAEAGGELETDLLADCVEKELLAELLARAGERGEVDTAGFVGSMADPERARLATRALSEEQRREAAISQVTARERFEGYLDYVRKKRADRTSASRPADDEQLQDYVRRLKEKDREAAESR